MTGVDHPRKVKLTIKQGEAILEDTGTAWLVARDNNVSTYTVYKVRRGTFIYV